MLAPPPDCWLPPSANRSLKLGIGGGGGGGGPDGAAAGGAGADDDDESEVLTRDASNVFD